MKALSHSSVHPLIWMKPSVLVVTSTLLATYACGLLLPRLPLLIVPIVGMFGLILLCRLERRAETVFLISLAVLLLGYSAQGKGFAYVGVPPLYVGELVLLLGLAALAFGHVRWKFSALELLIIAFMALGLIQTIPYIGVYDVLALRDAALWYYAAFAIIVSLLLTENRFRTFVQLYGKALGPLLVWLAVMPIVVKIVPASLPHFPGSPLPIVSLMKPGDRGVILAGLAVFVLTGLYARTVGAHRMSSPMFWSWWLIGAFMVAAWSRGSMLAMGAAMLMVALLKPSREWLNPIVIGSVSLALLFIVNPKIDTGGYREFTVRQLTTNVTSIFSDDTDDSASVQGNKRWRLQWWNDIYNDTFHGPYFWTGRGFGVNLATVYGVPADDYESLRSPHSSHMTILARMGVPGLAVWVMLNVGFANHMIRAFRVARRHGHTFWMNVDAWLLAMWLAAMVNASFDVYLEGPQGAIPFWCTMGAGMASMRLQRALASSNQPIESHIGGERHANPARS